MIRRIVWLSGAACSLLACGQGADKEAKVQQGIVGGDVITDAGALALSNTVLVKTFGQNGKQDGAVRGSGQLASPAGAFVPHLEQLLLDLRAGPTTARCRVGTRVRVPMIRPRCAEATTTTSVRPRPRRELFVRSPWARITAGREGGRQHRVLGCRHEVRGRLS
jgi:hypothetical protein